MSIFTNATLLLVNYIKQVLLMNLKIVLNLRKISHSCEKIKKKIFIL